MLQKIAQQNYIFIEKNFNFVDFQKFSEKSFSTRNFAI